VLRSRPDAILSVDTYKSGVARRAIELGAEIVNDVSAFQWDFAMAATCAELQCGVVMMHTRGRPREWRDLPSSADVTALVAQDLANRVQIALDRGVRRERIVLDPGFGFGKRYEENYPLLARFDSLQRLGFPLLAGTSRKSFVGRTVGKRRDIEDAPANERLYGSLAAMVASILSGAHIVRVHDVRPAVDAAAVADEVLAAMTP
jgi:dihydropteroate synthase